MADFFPLRPGRAMTYQTRSPQGQGASEFKVLKVAGVPGRVEAACERRTRWPGDPETVDPAIIVVDKDAVRVDGGIELKFPLVPGVSWDEHPRRYEITAIDAEATTKGGVFKGCIEITYTIAGGDAGFGRRLYAPDVGFVYESCSDETDPFEVQLTGMTG